MNATIKDILAKIGEGIAEDKKPLIAELEQAVEAHVTETAANAKPVTIKREDDERARGDDVRKAAESYRSERGTPQPVFKPSTDPHVPSVSASFDNLLKRGAK